MFLTGPVLYRYQETDIIEIGDYIHHSGGADVVPYTVPLTPSRTAPAAL